MWVKTITHSIEKIISAKQMIQTPTPLVPNFSETPHVCHDKSISFICEWNQGFSLIFPSKHQSLGEVFELKYDRYPGKHTGSHQNSFSDGKQFFA